MSTLFVEADEPLLIFPSIEVAERYLEATDVRAGTYPRAFGPLGEIYDIIASGNHALIRQSDTAPQPDRLKVLIIAYLAAIGEPISSEADLPTLVSTIEAHEAASWSKHDPYGERFSKRVPWWGCLLAAAAVSALIYVIWHLVANVR